MTRHEETQKHSRLDLSHRFTDSAYAVVHHRVYMCHARIASRHHRRKSVGLIPRKQVDAPHDVKYH